MKNKNLKKIAILSALSSMLLSGCTQNNVKNDTNNEKQIITEEKEESKEETIEIITNPTLEKIIEEYNKKTGKNIQKNDLLIEEFDKPLYIWNTEGENYIYDYKINNTDYPGYKYIDPGYHGKMYAVILKTENGSFEPISALANIDGTIINVKVTYLYGDIICDPSENYIIIDNPTKDDFNNIKNADEYIKSEKEKQFKNMIYLLKLK